jgi:hypothetical protein
MSDPGPRIERIFERVAGIASGSRLHPAVLLQEVRRAAERSIRDGSVANAYTIGLSESEAPTFRRHSRQLQRALETMLDELSSEQRVRPVANWWFSFDGAAGVRPGEVKVSAAFRNEAAGSVSAPGPTQVITRHRGLFLEVEGIGRVALTHTPFTIGRGRECDLAIPDLAISRLHARIERGSDGTLVMRDLGSRNRLVVGGMAVEAVSLRDAVEVTLGGTTVRFEVASD